MRILAINGLNSTAQKINIFVKDFFSKCDQIPTKLRIWSHLLKNSFTENDIFCTVLTGCCGKFKDISEN